MSTLWLFLHLAGFTMWIGGGLGAMFAGIASKKEERVAMGAVVRAQSVVYKSVIGPGALLTVLSGLVLTLLYSGKVTGPTAWLMVMQGAGIVGGLLTLFISVPTSAKLARLDPMGQAAAYFDELRARQKVVSMIAGALALAALIAGALSR